MRAEIVVAVENLWVAQEIHFNTMTVNHLHTTTAFGFFHRMIHSLSGSQHGANKWLLSDTARR